MATAVNALAKTLFPDDAPDGCELGRYRVQRPQNSAVFPKHWGPHGSDESQRKTRRWGAGQGVLLKWAGLRQGAEIHVQPWGKAQSFLLQPKGTSGPGSGSRRLGHTLTASPRTSALHFVCNFSEF